MRLNDDLSDPKWIHLKGWMFLLVAGLAGVALLAPILSVQNALLLGICVWAACRWYYYMFYVVEKYVDSEFRFAGLVDFVRYLLRKRKT